MAKRKTSLRCSVCRNAGQRIAVTEHTPGKKPGVYMHICEGCQAAGAYITLDGVIHYSQPGAQWDEETRTLRGTMTPAITGGRWTVEGAYEARKASGMPPGICVG